MRTIFMGTDRFAVPTLKAIIDSDVELLCVITQPDRPGGRKLKPAPSPVKKVAIEKVKSFEMHGAEESTSAE